MLGRLRAMPRRAGGSPFKVLSCARQAPQGIILRQASSLRLLHEAKSDMPDRNRKL